MSGAALAGPTIRPAADAGTHRSALLRVDPHGTRSVVTRALATSPLRLLTPGNHGDAAWIFTSTYGGGFVGGDRVRLRVDVGAGATALLQTQASTKVYRSPRGASYGLDAHVEPGGRLLILPDPTVCFAGAAFDQAQQVEVAAGGSLVLMDWLTSGRRASGERWAFDHYASRITVRYDGRLVLVDAMRLSPDEGPLARRMGRFDCVCLIVLIGGPLRGYARAAREQIASLEARPRPALLCSAAPLGLAPGSSQDEAGGVIRIAGESVEAVGHAARRFLSFVPDLLGDDPWSRKW